MARMITSSNTPVEIELTARSLETFLEYADDAPNWSGNPWVSQGNIDCTKERRGNLADLVSKGLIKIEYGGGPRTGFIIFTALGLDLARAYGHELT